MSKTRGIVFEAEVSRDVEPDALVLYDRSRYQNDGVITPGAGGYVQLPSGLWVYEFDGAVSIVNCGNDPSLQGTNFSFTTWAYFNTLAANDGLITKSSSTLESWRISEQATGTLVFMVGNPFATVTSNNNFLTTGTWIYIAVTKLALTVIFYKNGIGEPADTLANDMTLSTSNDLILGRLYTDAVNFFFDGMMASPCIYNYALSAGQILKHFEAERSLFGV